MMMPWPNKKDRQQIELGFGLARDDPIADAELPFPNARSDRRHGEFNALVDHLKNPAAAPTASKYLKLQILTNATE